MVGPFPYTIYYVDLARCSTETSQPAKKMGALRLVWRSGLPSTLCPVCRPVATAAPPAAAHSLRGHIVHRAVAAVATPPPPQRYLPPPLQISLEAPTRTRDHLKNLPSCDTAPAHFGHQPQWRSHG